MPSKKIVAWGDQFEARRDKRQNHPTVVISLDGATYRSVNWSLGGVLVSDYYGGRLPGAEVEGCLRLATGFESHGFKGAVARRDLKAGLLALHFTELSDGAFSLLDGASLEAKS